MKWMHIIIRCRGWVRDVSSGQRGSRLNSHPTLPLNRALNLSLASVLLVIFVNSAGTSQLGDLYLSITFS